MAETSEGIRHLLLACLRSALWGEPLSAARLSAAEAAALFAEARRQSVVGMVADVLLRQGVQAEGDEALYAYADLQEIRERNRYVDGELAAFSAFLTRHGVRQVVVKGQVAARAYPHPDVRQSGDIDFYLDAANYAAAKPLIEKQLGVELLAHASEKHVEFGGNGVHYEMHSVLADFAYPPHQRAWERLLRADMAAGSHSVEVAGTAVPTLSPTLHALYIFYHILYHLAISGVGLRQFCDWAAWLVRYEAEVDGALLRHALRELGLQRAWTALGAVLTDALGVPAEALHLPLAPRDSRRGDRILRNVFRMGNFGHNVHGTGSQGLRRSLETGSVALCQSLRFLPLAPAEMLLRVPKLLNWYVRR
ncbi:MAG: nucleotidyltransferase family protein [Alloprevotella sp.]|nr:nucleotidyltransferase family protein [Alloprevotella sp.]